MAGMALKTALEKVLDFALGHEVHGPVVFYVGKDVAAAAAAATGVTLKMTLDFVLGHEIHGCGVVSVGEDVVAAVAAAAANK